MAAAVGNEMPAPRQCAAPLLLLFPLVSSNGDGRARRYKARFGDGSARHSARGDGNARRGVAELAVSDRPRRLHNVSTTHSEL